MDYLDTSAGWPGPAALAAAALVRDHGADLPAVTFTALAAYYASPVVRIVASAEALWAVADTLPPAGLTLCGQLARVAQENAFLMRASESGPDTTADRMLLGVRRRLGELTETDAPAANDPAPLPEYAPPSAP